MKILGVMLLTLVLAATSALPNATAPSGTTNRDAARTVLNLPLRSGRRTSRALPIEESLGSLSLQEKSAPRGPFLKVFDARVRQMLLLSASALDLSAVTSVPLSRLCRLRI